MTSAKYKKHFFLTKLSLKNIDVEISCVWPDLSLVQYVCLYERTCVNGNRS